MSAPSTDQSDPVPTGNGGRSKLVMKAVATVAAFAALVFGANAITKGDSSSVASSGAQNAPAAAGAPGGGGPGGGAPGGGARGGMRPRMGTPVTGTTLTRLTQVATAKYPGTVERAMKLSDGSYVVHVMQSDGTGELHVQVSKDFEVTGTQQGGPPGGAPPAGQTSPGGSSSSAAS